VATQLEQLLAQLDRPGVTELTLAVGSPITIRTVKGVMNVTARPLGTDQLANIVRGTALEALLADENAPADPVSLKLGARAVTISVERGDNPTLRLAANRDATKRPRTQTRARTNPPVDTLMDGPEPGEAPALELPTMPAERPRTMTATPNGMLIPPAIPAPVRPQDPQGGPPELDLAPEPEPEPAPAEPEPDDDSFELGPPQNSGPPGLELALNTGPSQAFDVELPPPRESRPSVNRLRIDVSMPPASAAPDREGSGILAVPRHKSMPLAPNARSLDALGLPSDIATTVARERSLVLITAPEGHGKTSTLAALFDLIDRSWIQNVITIDELRDRESFDLALTAAESGYLVLATLAAASPRAAVDSLLDHYPGMAHGRVKTRMLGALNAVIAKRLPPTPTDVITGAGLKTLIGD